MSFTTFELTELDNFIDFMHEGEESTLSALRIQERLSSPFIPPFDKYPEQNIEVPHNPKSKYHNAKTQKLTAKSIQRARERCEKLQAKKNTYLTIKNARIRKYDCPLSFGACAI